MNNEPDENPHSESHENMLNNRSNTLIFENLKWLNSREAVMYLRLPSEGALRNLAVLASTIFKISF